MKLLKTIRFDPSDTHVFEKAAEPDEWAIPGTFWFQALQKEDIAGKTKQAFSNGFLSIESYGFSTFTSVSDIAPIELDEVKQKLEDMLLAEFGAPDKKLANSAATGELEYAMNICSDVPINSIFAIKRDIEPDGNIREQFTLVEPKGEPLHTKVWEIVE